jgi:hypothetical protein
MTIISLPTKLGIRLLFLGYNAIYSGRSPPTFGRTFCLPLQGRRVSEAKNQHEAFYWPPASFSKHSHNYTYVVLVVHIQEVSLLISVSEIGYSDR